jgi:hypothetical protein
MICFGIDGLYGFLNELKPNTSSSGLPRTKIISGRGMPSLRGLCVCGVKYDRIWLNPVTEGMEHYE